jgi:putative two-component system response regulator
MYDAKSTVLLVDDHDMLRDLLKAFLEEENFNVLEASDGEQGLHIYKKHKQQIKAVITDYEMPYLDGIKLIDKIRAEDKSLIIVLMSGYNELEKVTKNVSAAVLHKPFQIQSLFNIIQPVQPVLVAH